MGNGNVQKIAESSDFPYALPATATARGPLYRRRLLLQMRQRVGNVLDHVIGHTRIE